MGSEWSAVLDAMDDARSALRCSKSGAYYRGHSSREFKLLPRLHRATIHENAENNIYYEIRIRARSELGNCHSSWEVLSILQHYGVPTRLLDWTTSFAVALFFAIASNPSSPTIWVANGFNLIKANKKTARPSIYMAGMGDLPDYHKCFIEHSESWPYEFPVFMEIPWNNPRIVAQGGAYSFHSNPVPLEVSCPKFVRSVEIPLNALDDAKKFLNLAGTTEFTVFPDLAGMGMYFANRYKV
jgi:hypothetical protein